jgi:hypothetical protein
MRTSTRRLTTVRAVQDETSLERINGGIQVDFSFLTDEYREGAIFVTAAAPGADQNDVGDLVVKIAALDADREIPNGTTLRFGAGKFATLTAPAFPGDDTLTVEALVAAIVAGNRAVYLPMGHGSAPRIPAFTVMSKLTSGLYVPRKIAPAGRAAVCVIETDADEVSPTDALSGYGALLGGVLYESLMPEAVDDGGGNFLIPTAYKTELAAAGCTFKFGQYRDSRVL